MKQLLKCITICTVIGVVLTSIHATHAGSATWKQSPTSSDWNTASNWTPETLPNGPSDIATFGTSSITAISISADVEVKQIVFSPGASAYTLAPANVSADLTLDAPGITSNSGILQQFGGETKFNHVFIYLQNGATAGNLTAFSPAGSFYCTNSDLGAASITSTYGGTQSSLISGSSSTAAQASFDVGGGLSFGDFSNAGDANFLIRGSLPDGTPGGGVGFDVGTSAVNARNDHDRG